MSRTGDYKPSAEVASIAFDYDMGVIAASRSPIRCQRDMWEMHSRLIQHYMPQMGADDAARALRTPRWLDSKLGA